MSSTVPVAKQTQKKSAANLNTITHHEQVAKAAYFHAEHRGFIGGDPVADWLTAEAEINAAPKKSDVVSGH